MKTRMGMLAIALAVAAPTFAQVKSGHLNVLNENFQKVYVISDPIYIWAPHDVQFYTVSTSMAHQASVNEKMKGFEGSPYFTKGLNSFDVDGTKMLYDYYHDSAMWARYDWTLAQIALRTNDEIVSIMTYNMSF